MKSVDDTFDRLRRIPYIDACVIYAMANINLPSTTPTETLNRMAEEDLRIAGWTIEELFKESVKREKEDVDQNNN